MATKTYKTTILRRDKSRGKSAFNGATIGQSGDRKGTYSPLTHEPVNETSDESHRTAPQAGRALPSTPHPPNPLLTYITSLRERNGLETKAERSPSPADRESVMATSGPIAGIKDLRMVSKRLSNLQGATAKQSGSHMQPGSEFVYCLRQDVGDLRMRYNPYNLQIVAPEKARALGSYYTVSAVSVAQAERGAIVEVVPVNRWLWERQVFYQLLSMPSFATFKLRRAFIAWRRWVCNKKASAHKSALQKCLFSADVFLQKALLHIRCLCEVACSSESEGKGCRVSSSLSLVKIDTSVTYPLEGFVALQEECLSRAVEGLQRLREEIAAVIVTSCKAVVESEGIRGLIGSTEAEDVPPPKHTQVLEWRVVLDRLKRFVRLCECLVLELLQRLVMRAVSRLEHCIRRAVGDAALAMQEQREQFGKMRECTLSQPYSCDVSDRLVFNLGAEGDEGAEEEEEEMPLALSSTPFTAFMPSEVTGMTQASCLLEDPSATSLESASLSTETHLQSDSSLWDPMDEVALLFRNPQEPVVPLWEVKLVLRKESMAADLSRYVNERPRGNPVTSPLPEFQVSFQPSASGFTGAISQLLKSYQSVVRGFVSFLKDERVIPFISKCRYDLLMVMEEAESSRSRRQASWPDVSSLVCEYAPYKAIVGYTSRTLQATLSEIERSSTDYHCFGQMVESCSHVDISSPAGEREWSVAIFQRALAHYHDQVHAMEHMIRSFRVGMVRVEVGELQEECLAYPRAILHYLEHQLPYQAHQKASRMATAIKTATDKLVNEPSDVEAFVQYLSHVEEVAAMIPSVERGLLTLTNLHNVAQDFQVAVGEEEMALYKALFPQFRYLKNLLLQAEATKSETVYQFTSDLRTLVVGVLNRARELRNAIQSPSLMEGSLLPDMVLQELKRYENQLEELLTEANNYVEYSQRFGAIPTSRRRYHALESPSHHSWTPEEVHEEVVGVQQVLRVRQTLFTAQRDWCVLVGRWSREPLPSMDVAQLQRDVNTFVHTVDYLERGLPSNHLVSSLREEVVTFRSHLPTLHCLLNPLLKLRHWEAIEQATGSEEDGSGGRDTVTIQRLLERKVFDHYSLIATVSNQANHEAALEKMLRKVSTEWVSKEFTLVPYQTVGGRQTFVLGGVDDLLASLEDSITTLVTIKSSKHVVPIKHAVLDWENRLSLVLETVEQWVVCQRNWLYLEVIFSAADIQRQLSNEARLFLQADKSWREAIRIVSDKPTALRAATTSGVLEAFQTCGVLLEQVFKGLEDYLESKRLAFPRLYFISNSELLDILARIRDPAAIQPYLSKLFGNIKRLEMDSEASASPPILAMVSSEGERIELPNNLYARGSPELWLGNLEKAMTESIGKLLSAGVNSYDSITRRQWALEHPGQVVLTAAQIDWTVKVDSSLQSSSPKNQLISLRETWEGYLEELAELTTSGEVSAMKQCVVAALVTLDVHARDVIDSLQRNDVATDSNFEWIRHLRYYWHSDNGSCSLHQCFATFPYGNEYLGCLPRLVLTPLSERCYLTLTTALHLHLGGSPIGPAGTGKSETVKDLAKAMGKLCLIFNCSEGLDYKMMGRFFSGMCQSGVWCCFDEFNRIDIEVLSVVAQQLQCIKTAKDCSAGRFIFEGREVKLVPSCATFITMNPGYAGRVELPDNLKTLFRPVAMMVPDSTLIAEVLLFTRGFTSAPSLAMKLTKLCQTAEAQLSRQVHYDFGLRAIKATVVLAGDYIRNEKRSGSDDVDQTHMEKKILLQAIVDSTLPKLLAIDAHIMELLLQRFFPETAIETVNESMQLLKAYLDGALEERSLQCCEAQMHKCAQLYSTMHIRHGVMLIGPTGGGKSTIVRLLQTALNMAHTDYYGQKGMAENFPLSASLSLAGSIAELMYLSTAHCQLKTVNPKCLSVRELYGSYDSVSLDWRNGVLSRALQVFSGHTEAALQAAREREAKMEQRQHFNTQLVKGDSVDDESSEVETNPPADGSMDVIDKELPPDQSGAQSTATSTSTLDPEVSPSGRENLPGLPYPPCAPVGWRWLLLDGPVDPGWVENLNSTLDDSKLLCLANGERVELRSGMRILFETDNLANGSPATISRCGMIYVDPSDLGWKPYVLSWMKELPSNLPDVGREYLSTLFEQTMDEGLQFLKEHASELSCPLPASSAVTTLCHILTAFLQFLSTECGGFSPPMSKVQEESLVRRDEASASSFQGQTLTGIYIPTQVNQPRIKARDPKRGLSQGSSLPFLHRHPERICELLGKLFVFAFTWAFGGCFECVGDEETPNNIITSNEEITRGGTTARSQFDAFIHTIFIRPAGVSVKLPASADLIYSYYVDISSCTFVQWKRLIPSSQEIVTRTSMMQRGIQALSSKSFSFLDRSSTVGELHRASEVGFVPTVDTVRLCFLALLIQKAQQPVLLSGNLGVGKTCVLTYLTKLLQAEDQKDAFLSSILGRNNCTHRLECGKEDTEEMECQNIVTSLHVSSHTTSSFLQSCIEKHLVRKNKNTLRAPQEKTVVLCLDDLNMATSDSYGNQPCAELLRQLVDKGGWHDRKTLTWKGIDGVSLLATIGGRGWGYRDLNQRCLNKFSLFCLPEPSISTLSQVFSTHVMRSFLTNKLSSEITDSISLLVSCAIHVYQEVRRSLLPSPSAPQYTFCTRDLAKAFSGLLRARRRKTQTRDDVIHLLCHELMRVLQDRCLPADRDIVLETMSEALRIYFKVTQPPSQMKEQLYLYENFTDQSSGYSAVKNVKKLVKHLERIQGQYNIAEDENSQLIFFPVACEHVVRVTRVLQQPGGHLLLLGMGGVGRRSCVKLASYISGCRYHHLTSACGKSGGPESREEVKEVLVDCGVSDSPCVVLVTETLGENDSLFHDLHELLVSGEVAGMFEKEEVEGIVSQLHDQEGPRASTTDLGSWRISSFHGEIWTKFVEKVRHNLHLVLCFSPSSHQLAGLCRSYPGLVTQCTVDVFDEWPAKALYGVAGKELHHAQEKLTGEVGSLIKAYQTQVAMASVKVHGSIISASQKARKELGYSPPVTPSNFIYFIQTFCKTLQRQHERINGNCSHLETGLHRLSEADETVATMTTELEELKPEVEEKAQEADSLLEQLSAEQAEVDALRAAVDEEREEIARESEHVAALTAEAEADLLSVLPALEDAETGLNALKKSDLLEIRSYQTPPSMVMHVMSAVCLLLQLPTDWSNVKHLMADPMTFLRRLTSFDKDNVPDKVLSKVKKYTRDSNFKPDKVAHYSVACQSFCQWVLAIEHYARVYRVVEPKMQLHQEMDLKLQAVRKKLEVKEVQLKELELQLARIQEEYSVKVSERDFLQGKCKEITIKLNRAEALTSSLGDEQVRWHETLTCLQTQKSTLMGDSLLSAACLAYAGLFTPTHRHSLLDKWRHVCLENKLQINTEFVMESRLVEADQIQEWYAQGLPKDSHSVQNAIVITQCEKWPLIIDPQEQATRWLKVMLKDSDLMVASYLSPSLTKTLEEGMRAGLPVLVEDAPEQLNSLLEPYLVRSTLSSQGQLQVRVGKTQIECNPSFRLYLICKKLEPQLTSELCINTTVVNFSATFKGLQGQLLSSVIKIEEPALESHYSELLLNISSDRRRLKEMEQSLLDLLESTSGNLLDNEDLVLALQQTKEVAIEVEERLAKTQLTQEEVHTARRKYQPVATRGAVLYFCLLPMKHVSSMYQFSLEWLQAVFLRCLQQNKAALGGTDSSDASTTRKDGSEFKGYVTSAVDHLMRVVYKNASMAFSSDHHLLFAFKMCSSILMQGDKVLGLEPSISKAEWLLFTDIKRLSFSVPDGSRAQSTALSPVPPSTGSPVHSRRTPSGRHRKYAASGKHRKVPKPESLSQGLWDTFSGLENLLPCFAGLLADVACNTTAWNNFICSQNPWKFQFISTETGESSHTARTTAASDPSTNAAKPGESSFNFDDLSHFQKLLLIKTVCPQLHLTDLVRRFIEVEMNAEFTKKPPLGLGDAFKESSSSCPILIILGPGTDPTSSISNLSAHLLSGEASQQLSSVSLGQGQGERAWELIRWGVQYGGWVFLQNCHLATSWMPQLENILPSLKTADVHPEFRLWLSSKPTHSLPSNVLQSSIKLSLESPQSLKVNLQQLMSCSNTCTPVISQSTFEDVGCGPAWRQLLLGLCLFHATASGRGKYGRMGWNSPYLFSPVDLQVAVKLLQSLLSTTSSSFPLPWTATHRLVGEICYGGRVTDSWDSQCLEALLRKFCAPGVLREDHCYVGHDKTYGPIGPITSYSMCCAVIESLPDAESPEVYGLSSSQTAEMRSSQSQQLQSLLHTVEFPAEFHGITVRSQDEIILDKVSSILDELPESIDIPNIWSLKVKIGDSTSPTRKESRPQLLSPYWVVLAQEVSEHNRRLRAISASLTQVMAAVRGEIGLLEAIEETYQALGTDTIPKAWQHSSLAPAVSLAKWIKQFLEHHNFVAKWASLNLHGNLEPRLPKAFWLEAFNFPTGLLAAIAQDFAQRCQVPLEKVELRYEECAKAPEGGVMISGLYLEGAHWKSGSGLIEKDTSTEDKYIVMPGIVCYAAKSGTTTARAVTDGGDYYVCPLYVSPSTRDFITSIPLWTTVQPDHWILKTVALFTQAHMA